jgi:hypothetical protein
MLAMEHGNPDAVWTRRDETRPRAADAAVMRRKMTVLRAYCNGSPRTMPIGGPPAVAKAREVTPQP